MKPTKRTLIAAILFLAAPPLAWADRAEGGCIAKRQALERKLEAARTWGNVRQQAGLERALRNVDMYCTDTKLRREWETKVAEQRDAVRNREAELRQAEAIGDPAKILKRQEKLKRAIEELAAVERERPQP